MISAPISCANSRAILLLPTAVGPTTITILGFIKKDCSRVQKFKSSSVGKKAPRKLNPATLELLNILLAYALEHSIQVVATEFKQNRTAVRTLSSKIDFIELV